MTEVLPSTDQLDAVVRQVPGVDALYPAGSIVSTVLSATVHAVTHPGQAAPMVLIEKQADGVRVTVRIGIGATESSTEVSGRVHDAIAAHVGQSGTVPVAQIAVIVARIG
ncbi:hypothetical protein [Cryobacterium aureum]|uniref:hypothetical protein n=1 Tax=Cryobacterium aureum TaxID=995037 RepID=UPI000CF41566|nr:hypothetical protein [Cryobacterium aureum]